MNNKLNLNPDRPNSPVKPVLSEMDSDFIAKYHDLVDKSKLHPVNVFESDYWSRGLQSSHELHHPFTALLQNISKDLWRDCNGKIDFLVAGSSVAMNFLNRLHLIRNFDINNHDNIQNVGYLYNSTGQYYSDVEVACLPDQPVGNLEMMCIHRQPGGGQRGRLIKFQNLLEYSHAR